MPEPETTWDAALSWRMDRHLLDRPSGLDAAAVVERLAGVQAQVSSSADQAVAVRRAEHASGLAPALADRSVVKTWAMRGTLHLLRPADAAACLALIADTRSWLKPAWQREFATAAQMDAIAEAATAVLAGAELTRDELAREIVERSGDPSLGEKLTSGWGALLKPLAWQGLLCHGPERGARVTFTAPSTWFPGWSGLPEPDTAARTAVPAYLAAHGPSGPEAFAQWLTRGAMRVTTARRWFAALVDDGVLAPVRVEGETLYVRAEDVDGLVAAAPTRRVRLLPGFDQYVLGPGTRDPQVLAPERRARVSRAAGWIAPVVVAGGRVAGTWKVDGSARDGSVLDIELFAEAGPLDRDAIDAEAAVLGDVLGATLAVTVAEV